MKKFTLFTLLLTFAVILTACGSNESSADEEASGTADGKVELTFWHSMGGEPGEGIDELVKRYNEQSENVNVTAEYQGSYDDTLTKLRNSTQGSEVGADIVQVFELGARNMIDSGLIVPVQDYIDKSGYDINQIEPNLAAYYTIEGKLNSMPFNSSTPLLYYNKDMFEQAGIEETPSSMEEINEIGAALMEEGGAEMPISMNIYGWWFDQWMNKQGLDMFDNGNGREENPSKVVFDENQGIENALDTWNQLYEDGYAPNVGRNGGQPEFVAGESAMTFASTATLRTILNEVGDSFEVGTAYFPSLTEEDEGQVSIGGASLYMIDSEDEARKDAAWDFIEFMIEPESQAYWNAKTGYFPITVDAHEEPEFKENLEEYPQFQTAIDQLHDSNPESQGGLSTVYQEIRQIQEAETENMLNGSTTPEEAAQNIIDQSNNAIENYNRVNNQ